MRHTTMPGFTAERSLRINGAKYCAMGSVDQQQTLGRVLPQMPPHPFACFNVKDGVCCGFGDDNNGGGYCIENGKLRTWTYHH